MAEPDFWNDQERARGVVGELKSVKAILKPLDEAMAASDDLAAMVEMAEEDDGFAAEVPGELERLERRVADLELKALLSGPLDGNDAILSINARDGGTDANDWAEMLLRMYVSWAEGQDYDVELLDRQDNEEAGINSAAIAVRGPMAYGYLKGETGMHRLVRISPFNAEGKRQTSFASVDVTPEVNGMIVALGGNDLLRGIDPGVTRVNLERILRDAQARDVPVLLVGMRAPGNYGPDYAAEFDAIYPELAAEYDVLLHPYFFAGLGEGTPDALRPYFQPDGIHPNRKGVVRIVVDLGPSVLALLERAGVSRK